VRRRAFGKAALSFLSSCSCVDQRIPPFNKMAEAEGCAGMRAGDEVGSPAAAFPRTGACFRSDVW